MCLISIANIGDDKYSKEFKESVEHGMRSQEDGSGYAYWRKGEKVVNWSKGYFEYDKIESLYGFKRLWKELEDLKLTKDDILVVHHRTSTSGKVNTENCHPFNIAITRNATLDHVTLEEGKTNTGVLFHNGTFAGYSHNIPGYSDTVAFTCELFLNKPEIFAFLKRDPELFYKFFKEKIKGNKIAVLTPGKLITIGDFVQDSCGYVHSNSGYAPYKHYRDVGGYNINTITSPKNDEDEDYYGSMYGACEMGYPDREAYKRNLKPLVNNQLAIAYTEQADDPKKYKRFLPVFNKDEEKEDDFIREATSLKIEDSFKTDSANSLTIGKIKDEVLGTNKSFNQRCFKQLLMLDSTHCFNFTFQLKEDFGIIKAGSIVRTYDFDYQKERCLITHKSEKQQTSLVTGPTLLLEKSDVIPAVSNAAVYITYAKLCKLGNKVTNNNLKYYRNILKGKKGDIIKIKKPVEIAINKAGLKLYLDMWDLKNTESPFKEEKEVIQEWSETAIL